MLITVLFAPRLDRLITENARYVDLQLARFGTPSIRTSVIEHVARG
jgi:hypothetical protein